MQLTRRTFLRASAAASALAATGLRCGGGMAYDVTVGPADHGKSVLAATARRYEVRTARSQWQNPRLRGLQMVTAVDGFEGRWVFEVDGATYDGSTHAAERVRVRAGQVITWREV